MTATARVRETESEELLFRLLRADSEEEAVSALQEAGFWDDPAAWRLYGDLSKNYSSAGNQQRSAEAALVEKVINSVDACLMRRCYEEGIDPYSAAAPATIREAVAMFYDGAEKGKAKDYQGTLTDWSNEKRTRVSRDICLSLTGPRAGEGRPCVTIADAGEGQAPGQLPVTILSLDQGLKETLPFVQGKFNMGGTGVLRFCGHFNLQLVVSKRHPSARGGEESGRWGFTVVRREYPDDRRRISTYRYLAPIDSDKYPNRGSVLSIERDSLPIFPEGQNAYSRNASSGTLIKLYDFDTKFKQHMFRNGGLQERLDLLIPGLALPVRLHECRAYAGHQGSFETTLAGLETRLNESSSQEAGFPDSGAISVGGQSVGVTIYAFKRNVARSYKRNEGVLFVVNGQAQASRPERFFQGKNVGMGYLASSLLVLLDCSALSAATYEELFMNSRDRLAEIELVREIEEELADLLSHHEGLRALREQRRREDTEAKIGDAKPLEEALGDILKKSPSLSALFLSGTRLSNPFTAAETPVGKEFEGKPHPTVFKFKDRNYGQILERSCHLGQRLRLTFETDVVNDYFTRDRARGSLDVTGWLNDEPCQLGYSMNLYNGYGHLNIHLPPAAKERDRLLLRVRVDDETLVEPFVNDADLRILSAQVSESGSSGRRSSREDDLHEGVRKLRPSGITLPKVIEVTRDGWGDKEMDEYSAVRIRQAQSEEEAGGRNVYDFFLNVENVFLQTEQKASPVKADLLQARFKFGMVLVGLGLLRSSMGRGEQDKDEEEDENGVTEVPPEDLVARGTDALAPILLPMIDSLGELELDEPAVYIESGGEDG